MLVFTFSEKKYRYAKEHYSGIFVRVSSDIPLEKNVEEGAQFLPPPDVLVNYIDTGDRRKFRKGYYRYLSDPRVMYALSLYVAAGAKSTVFFFCSKDEKEDPPYLKDLRNFIVECMDVPEEYICSFKEWNGDDESGLLPSWFMREFSDRLIDLKAKSFEAMKVYGATVY